MPSGKRRRQNGKLTPQKGGSKGWRAARRESQCHVCTRSWRGLGWGRGGSRWEGVGAPPDRLAEDNKHTWRHMVQWGEVPNEVYKMLAFAGVSDAGRRRLVGRVARRRKQCGTAELGIRRWAASCGGGRGKQRKPKEGPVRMAAGLRQTATRTEPDSSRLLRPRRCGRWPPGAAGTGRVRTQSAGERAREGRQAWTSGMRGEWCDGAHAGSRAVIARAGAGLAKTGHGGASMEGEADGLVGHAAIHRWTARDGAAGNGTVSRTGASGAGGEM